MVEPKTGALPRLIVLIGMKHCGKSSAGRCLAERIHADFFDSDDLLEELHSRRTGEQRTFRQIYKDEGKDCFQKLEADALAEFLAKNADSVRVLALGGATPLNPSLPAEIRKPHRPEEICVIHLQVCPDVLWARVKKTGIPAFVDPQDPQGSFRQICRSRQSTYNELSDIQIDADNLTVERVAERIHSALQNPW
jgi:shikimate kinase